MLDAAIHLLNAIIKVLLYPFTFWVKAIGRLAEQKKPIYDPTVGLNLDLLFDGLAFLSYPLGVLCLLIMTFTEKLYKAPETLIIALLFVYVLPIVTWLANIVTKWAIKLAITVIKILWTATKTFVLKMYNFVVNPQWHFAIKHIHVNKKEE
jgi:hypothetical protein